MRISDILSNVLLVAPLAGAWIEIDAGKRGTDRHAVAPLAGAWIEMAYN